MAPTTDSVRPLPRPSAATSRLSVLVLDDEPSMCRLYATQLDGLGFDLSIATSGEEAWAVLESQPIDLLITDWMLPGLSGPDLIQRIRLSEPVGIGRASGADPHRQVGLPAICRGGSGVADRIADPADRAG